MNANSLGGLGFALGFALGFGGGENHHLNDTLRVRMFR